MPLGVTDDGTRAAGKLRAVGPPDEVRQGTAARVLPGNGLGVAGPRLYLRLGSSLHVSLGTCGRLTGNSDSVYAAAFAKLVALFGSRRILLASRVDGRIVVGLAFADESVLEALYGLERTITLDLFPLLISIARRSGFVYIVVAAADYLGSALVVKVAAAAAIIVVHITTRGALRGLENPCERLHLASGFQGAGLAELFDCGCTAIHARANEQRNVWSSL